MRLALVIRSAYSETTVVTRRDGFLDNAAALVERIQSKDAAFEVVTLDASRELPEALEELLRSHAGHLESLLVHFTGYVAVKADRGPALLLDGSRLRAFPLSRLRAAIEDGAQQALVIIDGLSVVDNDQRPEFVAKSVGEALQSPSGSITSIVGLENERSAARRGALRMTDLFVLAISHLAQKQRGGLVTDNAVYQTMQSEMLSFADIDGVYHGPGHFEFVLLEGPAVGGVVPQPVVRGRTTQPVAELTDRLPSWANPAEEEEPESGRDTNEGQAEREGDEAESETPQTSKASDAAHPAAPAPDTRLPQMQGAVPKTTGAQGERRFPTLADTPRARAASQRDWISEAAYFPSAPPPPVTAVKPSVARAVQGTLPGIVDSGSPAEPGSSPQSTESAPRGSRPSMPSSPEHASAVIPLYEDLLAQLDASDDPRRAEVQAKLGDALRDAQRNAEALFAYERALDIDPFQPEAFEGACALYQQQRDFAGLVSTIRRKMDALEDAEERLALRDQIAEIWLHEAGDIPKGIVALKERLQETPDDVQTIQMLIDAHDRIGDLTGRLDFRVVLANCPDAVPELRAAAWVEAATLAAQELNHGARCFAHLKAAVATGMLLAHSLARAEETLGGMDRWLEVTELYEAALESSQSEPEAIQIATRLATLIHQHHCEEALKPETLNTLVKLAQLDAYLAEATIPLIETTNQGPEALEMLQRIRAAQPGVITLLHEVVRLSQHDHPDVATNVSSVLVALEHANEAEAELAKSLSTDTLPTPSRSLEHADYETLLYPAEFDRDMALGLARLEKALFAADAFEKKGSVAVPKDAPVIDPETSTVTLARSFLWTSRLMSVKAPELVLLQDPPTLFRFLPQTDPRLLVSRSLGSGFSLPELVYLVARQSALQLPGLICREHCNDPSEFGSLLYALGVVSDGRKHGVKSLAETDQHKLGKRLLAQLESDETLDADVDKVVGAETPSIEECEARAEHWLRSVDHLRLRAALLACGTPSIAIELNRKYPLDSLWSEGEQISLLAAFAGSPEHCELRSRLEIAAERLSQPPNYDV